MSSGWWWPFRLGLSVLTAFIIAGPGTQRLFKIQSQKRQNAQVTGIENIRTQSECAVSCTQQSQPCVGFNFKRGPPAMCELCSVPHDAPNTAMVPDQLWNHYAIVPWTLNVFALYNAVPL